MKDEDMTKEQLINELVELRQRITELQISETPRKRAEDALRKSELQYRSTLDSMGDIIHVIDTDLRFTLFNNAFKQINKELGFDADVMGRKISDAFPFLSDSILNDYNQVFETGKTLFTEENTIIRGREFVTETIKIPIFEEDKVTYIVTVIRDVTKRKRMEDAVRKSEKRFRELAELLPETVFEIDLKGNLRFANRIAFDVFGYSQEDFDRGINAFQAIIPEDQERLNENISRVFSGEDTGINEYVALKKDGSRLPVIIRSNVIRDDDENPVGIRGIIIDITERKQAEEKIREYTEKLEASEKRYRGLYDSSIDGIVSRDLEGYIIECNQAFANMLGYTKEELRQMPPEKLIPSKLFDSLNKFIEEQVRPRGYSDEFEVEYIKKDRTLIPASVRVWSIKDKDEKMIGTWAIIRDITVRKKIEESMKKMKEKYESLIKNIPDVIYSALPDATSTTIFVSERIMDWTGYSPYEFYKDNGLWSRCIHPEDKDNAVETFIKAYTKKKEYIFEYRMVHKETGKIRHIRDHGMPIIDEEGKILRFDGILTDITERKQAEEALLENEKKYRLVSENIPVVVYSALPDEHSTSLFISGRVEKLTGYTGEQFLADSTLWERVVHPDDIGYVWGAIEAHRRLKEPLEVEYRIITKDNIIKWIRDRAIPALNERNQLVRIDGYMEDITERKQAEDALKESEEKYRSLFENSKDAVFIIQKDKIVDINKAMLELFGYSREEMLRMRVIDVYANPADRTKFLQEIAQKGSVRDYEVKFRKKDGTAIDCLLTSSVKRDKNEAIVGYQGVIRDITERKKLEKELKESEERYRGLYESSIDGIVSLDTNGRILRCNQAFMGMLGYTKEELQICTVYDITPEKWHDENKKFHELILMQGYSKEFKKEYIKKDGTNIPVAIRGWVIKDKEDKTTGIWGFVRDITEKQKLEEELLKIEKLESLGILAGGIAHDFNNILTGILGNITLAKEYTEPGEKVFERLTEAEKASMRAKDLTQQLLTFSKGGAPIKKTVRCAELLKETTAFTLSGSNVRCEFSLPEDLWSAEIDEGQISQVINNLVINADQAMPEGGIIKISAENVTVGSEEALSLQEGNYVKITIQDEGMGIPKGHLNKIFDPYFTTKHKGSGLGLAVAYSIIKNHEGYLGVESELGVGSTFTIYLPASQKQPLSEKEAEKRIITGQGKILVMDDEKVIREAVGEILTYLGYQVEFVRNGEEAVALYKNVKDSRQPFDAVIMDLTVPGGMGGKEAIQKLIEIDPDVKAIVSSGYSTDPVMADFERYGFSGVVAKPYNIRELSETLHQIISKD